MALSIGTRLGPYEVVAAIGAGGMGEVYRARDTKLGRDVAIKILPDVFVRDAGRLARFEREARTLASLNHPNIAQIYGLETTSGETRSGVVSRGNSETTPDLVSHATPDVVSISIVMELVDGDDLQAVIARGPMPLAEALPIARQIAHALETAHEQGIVHRDLKPANIKVRPDGTVKVLDFGLAKGGDPAVSSAGRPLDSPTMTSPAMTELGMVIGTAAYMSPEQARGKAVDRRADVWAFGVVLYEMLSGRRAFGGGEVSDVLASVLKDSLPIATLPADTPPSIRRLLRRCLEKDRAERLDSMAAARLEIAEALSPKDGHAIADGLAVPASRLRTVGVPVAAAIAGAALAGLLIWRAMLPAAPVPSSFALTPPGGGALGVNINQPDLAISPDGRRIAYGSALADDSALIVRSLDAFGDMPLPNLGRQPRSPFFSPDSRWMGYFAAADSGLDAARLMKWPVGGGSPVEIAKGIGLLRGAAWLADDTILFATSSPAAGLLRVSASGGPVEVLTRPDGNAGETDHLWPAPLPGGRHVLFTITRAIAEAGSGAAFDIAAMDVATKQWRVIRPGGSYPRYVSTGHLVYATERGLIAVPFDPDTLEFRGEPRVVVDDLVFKPTTGAADVSISDTGTIAYVAGSAQNARLLTWIDRKGLTSPASPEARRYLVVRISPDGLKAATVTNDSGTPTLWVLEFDRGSLMRLSPPGMAVLEMNPPIWSESSRDIFFAGTTASGRGIFRVPASGTGAPQMVIGSTADSLLAPTGVVPGRSALLVRRTAADGQQDAHVLTLDGAPAMTPLIGGGQPATAATISPDGRWLAYLGVEGRGPEVYLRPFPDVNADRIKLSSGGARAPRWAQGGRALFYQDEGANRDIWTVEIGAPGSGKIGKPVRVTLPAGAIEAGFSFDVTADGQRFLVIRPQAVQHSESELRVVVNWFEVLKDKVRR